jgi:hypothetical protein
MTRKFVFQAVLAALGGILLAFFAVEILWRLFAFEEI